MSPPNDTSELHHAQEAPRENKLDNGVTKPDENTSGHPNVDPEGSSDLKDSNNHEVLSDTAGKAPSPVEEAGQSEQSETRPNDKGVGDGIAEDVKSVKSSQDTDCGDHLREKVPPAEGQPEHATIPVEPVPRTATPHAEPSNRSAGKAAIRSPSPPPPPPKDDKYLASGSGVSARSISPVSQERSSGRNSEDAAAEEYTHKYDGAEDDTGDNGDSQSEIQSIMEQFEHNHGGPGADEIMSPRLELAAPLLDSPVTHPPRRSSLVPVDKPLPAPAVPDVPERQAQSPPPRASSLYRVGTNDSLKPPMSPSAHAPQYKPTPPVPQPDPEPDLPFDFHRFLEQLRHRTADPVAKFLRSFLLEFGKKQWMVHEQVKIIGDFLEFIAKKMAQCEVWRTVSDAEFDNAREGMEKLVMNRLYNQTFSPAIPPPEPIHPTRGKRRGGEPLGPGRRGQHQEDVERDEVLAQKVRIYQWVREDHLDIKPVGEKGRKFLVLAQQELLKIKSYRAPRDKVICILNCCKVIFGLLRTSQSDQSADAFVPLLIYTVLQANPEHLVSNVQYILRFRNQDKLGGEAGYYISSLMGAIQFIEGLDKTSLTVSDAEFEQNVEAAVSAIAEKHSQLSPTASAESSGTPTLGVETDLAPNTPRSHRRTRSPHLHPPEKSTLSRPEVTPRNSLDAERAGPIRASSYRNKSDGDQSEGENAAVAGLLRTIQKPLSTIGRIFSDTDTNNTAAAGPYTPSPTSSQHPQQQYPGSISEKEQLRRSAEEQRHRERQRMSAEEAAARQASAEAEEARKIQRQEHLLVVETLAGMFPALDREVIDDVVRMQKGRVGLAVDACLALSNP